MNDDTTETIYSRRMVFLLPSSPFVRRNRLRYMIVLKAQLRKNFKYSSFAEIELANNATVRNGLLSSFAIQKHEIVVDDGDGHDILQFLFFRVSSLLKARNGQNGCRRVVLATRPGGIAKCVCKRFSTSSPLVV